MNALISFFNKPLSLSWSAHPTNWLAILLLVATAAAIAALTVWTYSGQLAGNRRRILALIALRLLALLVILLTALRPAYPVDEQPKIRTQLLIGVDISESMSVRDEVGNSTRIDAVRRTLDSCQPTLDALQAEQNMTVTLYGFGASAFTEATGAYDPAAPANAQQSDYRQYLSKTLEKWQGQKFVRGHILIGDGAENAAGTSALADAGAWRRTAPIQTFVVGTTTPPGAVRDVAIADARLDPDPVAIKNDVTLRAKVNAFGFGGSTVSVKVQYDLGKGYQDVLIERVKLSKDKDNNIELKLKAPDQLPEDENKQPRKQIKVRVEIPIADVPGDINPANNVLETYMNLTKEGLRVLIVDRYRYEYARLLDALAADPRIDVRKVDLQTDEGGAGLAEAFDFDDKAYDVMILGNISASQLAAIDPKIPGRIAERVVKKGMGFMMIGGHRTFSGRPEDPKSGWRGIKELEAILPVYLNDGPPGLPADFFDREKGRYQFVVNPRFADDFLVKIGGSRAESDELWDKLNFSPASNRSVGRFRFTGVSNIGTPTPTATTYAWTTSADALVRNSDGKGLAPLLVGHQIGDSNRGRVLVFGAQDTMLWQFYGQPKNQDGNQIHSRFWRQLVLWLAHQDTDESTVTARPSFPRLAVGSKQEVKFAIRGQNGAAVVNPTFDVTVFAPGDAIGKKVDVEADPAGGSILNYNPGAAGEYTVKVTASGKTAKGEDVKGDASAKFIGYPETAEEMIRTAADPDFMAKVAAASGGKAYRLDELPGFLKELRGQPLDNVKPKQKYLPNWDRKSSEGFLPTWLAIFAGLLVAEWALRRYWGMV